MLHKPHINAQTVHLAALCTKQVYNITKRKMFFFFFCELAQSLKHSFVLAYVYKDVMRSEFL